MFSTNTSNNQTVLKNIEYCVFVAHVRTNVEAYNLNQLKFDNELLWLGRQIGMCW